MSRYEGVNHVKHAAHQQHGVDEDDAEQREPDHIAECENATLRRLEPARPYTAIGGTAVPGIVAGVYGLGILYAIATLAGF